MNKKLSLMIIFFVIMAIVGGIYLFNKGNKVRQSDTKKIIFSDDIGQNESPDQQPTQEVSPTPDMAAYTIQILNGSGEAGKAQEIKSFLEEKGFTVGEIDNADNYDYTKTVIQYQKNISPVYLETLKTSLSEMFVVDEPQIQDASGAAQVTVIFGSETP